MQTLLGLSLCFALITAGTALECEHCSSLGSNCTGSLLTCESGNDTCIIVLSVNTLVGLPIYTINKGCGSSSACQSGSKYMNLGQGKEIRSSTTCCVGNACRTAAPELPPAITEPNGKRCPACYTFSSAYPCNVREKVDCVGPEDLCLDMQIVVAHGNSIFNSTQKGCVNKSLCDDLRRGEKDSSGVRIIVNKVECKAAPTA